VLRFAGVTGRLGSQPSDSCQQLRIFEYRNWTRKALVAVRGSPGAEIQPVTPENRKRPGLKRVGGALVAKP
jgi:hypothetical protein